MEYEVRESVIGVMRRLKVGEGEIIGYIEREIGDTQIYTRM